MSTTYISRTQDGFVATLTLSNPPRHTINAAGSQELFSELEQISSDSTIRVVVLTGASDDIFVRHYEVDELAVSSKRMIERRAEQPAVQRRPSAPRRESGLRGAQNLLESMNQITIAAINGMAHGGGLELALACDFRLVRGIDLTLGLPETGVGILPGGGGTQRLARLIGVARALDLILHGTTFNPQTALDLGIVSRVLSPSLKDFRDEVSTFANNLANRAPMALAHAKRAIREGIELPLSEGLRREAQLFSQLMASKDAANALTAVSEGRRIPPFTGE